MCNKSLVKCQFFCLVLSLLGNQRREAGNECDAQSEMKWKWKTSLMFLEPQKEPKSSTYDLVSVQS